jgi:hypothetical protein
MELLVALVATVVSVGLGVPVAWRLYLRQKGHQDKADEQARKALARQALEAVKIALGVNASVFASVGDQIIEGLAWVDLPFDDSSGPAVQTELSHLRDPWLRVQIALYFSGIQRVIWLHRQLFEFTSGTSASMSSSHHTRGTLRKAIEAASLHLTEKGKAIEDAINKRLNQQKTEGQPNG